MTTTTKRARVALSDYDLRVILLALSAYVEGLDGHYEDEHVHMDALAERLKGVRRRMVRP